MSDYKIKENSYSDMDKNIKIVFISAEFNREYTEAMEDINEKILKKNGFSNIDKFLVPGAFEIPGFLEKVISKLNPDLVVCFGVVIRGETTHYEMVAGESCRGIMELSMEKGNSAIINGILTCENDEQVKDRISDSYGISGLNLVREIGRINPS